MTFAFIQVRELHDWLKVLLILTSCIISNITSAAPVFNNVNVSILFGVNERKKKTINLQSAEPHEMSYGNEVNYK